MNYPLKNYIVTQKFGETITDSQGHTGIDLWQPIGTPVYASDGGDVLAAGIINNVYGNSAYGNCVLIDHKNGYYTFYAHMDEVKVKKGMSILSGTQIGTVGQTGNVTGPHLHFEIRNNPYWNRKNFLDPEKFLTFIDNTEPINIPNKPELNFDFIIGDKVKINEVLVNMRNRAGYSSNIITELKKNTELIINGNKIIKDGLEWYPVQLNGYVAASDGYNNLLRKVN